MKKLIYTFLLLIAGTVSQAQLHEITPYQEAVASELKGKHKISPTFDKDRPESYNIENGVLAKLDITDIQTVGKFDYYPNVTKNGKKVKYLTWFEMDETQKDYYNTIIRKVRERQIFVQDSTNKVEQNKILAEQKRIKMLEIDRKYKKDSLADVERKLNINEWGIDVGDMRTEKFTFSATTLTKLIREAKLNPSFYGDLVMLKVENDNVDYNDMDASGNGEWFNIAEIDLNLVFITVKISRKLSLIKNVKNGDLFIIKDQYLNYCADMFNCLKTTLAQYKTIDVIKTYTPVEIVILNRYKKVLSAGNVCTTTIATITNRKQYDFMNIYGQHFFDSEKVTPIDKQNHNNSIKKIWQLDKEWKTIREDEQLLNGNNKIMEKLLEDEKYLKIKYTMETMHSNSLI